MTAATCSELSARRAWLVTAGLLVPVQLLLLGWIACRTSATADEPAHLAAGVRLWQTGRCDLYLVNPPLVKLVAALPVILDPPQTKWERLNDSPGARSEWLVGLDFQHANRLRFRWDLVLARWACIPFSLLGLVYCHRWGAALFGPWAGMLAAALWCFSPNILGNGALITPDVPAAALGLAALFHFRRWLISSSLRDAALAGVLLGLTELTKMTWLILFPLLPALWLLAEFLRSAGTVSWRRRGLQLALILFVGLDVLNAGYLFEGTLQPLGEFPFVSQALGGQVDESGAGNRFAGTWLGALPVPVPAPYLSGLDLQRRDFEGGWKPMYSYRNGVQRLGGWPDYYLYGLAVKVPLGIWAIALAALAARPGRRMHATLPPVCEGALLLAPALVLFAVVSSQTGFSRYFRYVLPSFPFAFVTLSSVWTDVRPAPARWPARFGGAGLVAVIAASLSVFPHSLAFFNCAAGGPSQGHRRLLDSNLDWGQDLISLRDWQLAHPQARPFYLTYSGVTDPELYNIVEDVLPQRLSKELREFASRLPPGWYAISANHLHGYDAPESPWTGFLALAPIDRAGYSIFIYHIPEQAP